MSVNDYIKEVKNQYATGKSTEHSYRGYLQNMINGLVDDINITNEPKRQRCGAPDYIITRNSIPVGYIEAKDIGADLNREEKSPQMQRYLKSLDNLILTDYLNFRFFRYGKKVDEITIGVVEKGAVKPDKTEFANFQAKIRDFCDFRSFTIVSAKDLAVMMAHKARLMEEVLFNTVSEQDEHNTLRSQLDAFKKILLHDLDEKTFSDIYAQTIAYGLFAARLHDETPGDFSRQEARGLIPRSNPFLLNLFDYVLGPELDDRVAWIVDDLANIFGATDLKALLSDFGKTTGQNDPFIHFYETFLAEYDPHLRKTRGVYYTPEPVVDFIIRAVDDILKTEFKLESGLADTSLVKIRRKAEENDKEEEIVEVHKVQILDPAAGTGTFLSETVKRIYQKFQTQKGVWQQYVAEHLIPRLNGFEILMAPYTMCHLKLEILLRETGFFHTGKGNRLRVFLTNSLEEAHPEIEGLFASWLAREANEASKVKRETPVMVVMGNPPYSISSSNTSDWIQNLIKDYKENLNERKINIDDDYIKFIRFGEHFIERNGEGILAFISNNSFIDGITHRQMRKHLLETFDAIYILDLHGNARKKETCPDGSPDENVFDIMQGVSINIFVKIADNANCLTDISEERTRKLATVFHYELYGKRDTKYAFLKDNSLNSVKWNRLKYTEPYFFFVPKDFSKINDYESFIKLTDLMPVYVSGIQTKRDKVTIAVNQKDLVQVKEVFSSKGIEEIRKNLGLPLDGRDWKIEWAKSDLINNNPTLTKIHYRPFDYRYTYYTGKSKGFLAYPRNEVMKHFLKGNNIGLIMPRQCKGKNGFEHGFVSKNIIDVAAGDAFSGSGTYFFPLYLYPDDDDFEQKRKPNLNDKIIKEIEESTGLKFTEEETPPWVEETKSDDLSKRTLFAPVDILDYIYAVLHSPSYREKYKEFLKIDFPRVPYPQDRERFWKSVIIGKMLREIHLLEHPITERLETEYPREGNNVVEKVEYRDGRVIINAEQYFGKVPVEAWEFYIGGYQPAQKWLKDRKGRTLDYNDIQHYQKIIAALCATCRIMSEIDKV